MVNRQQTKSLGTKSRRNSLVAMTELSSVHPGAKETRSSNLHFEQFNNVLTLEFIGVWPSS